MDTVTKILLVGVGGFLGSNARYWLGALIQERLGGGAGFPWQTMLINISGSLVIGFFMGLYSGENWNPNWRLFIAIGILGGYTTFSSFAYEAVNLLGQKQYGWALFYIEGSALLTVLGAWIGLVLARLVLGGRI
jgi:CrcB protein